MGVGNHLPLHFYTVPGGTLGGQRHSFSMHLYTVSYGALGGWTLNCYAFLHGARRYPGEDWALIHAFFHGGIWCPGGVGHSFTMHFYTVPGGTLGGIGHSFSKHVYTVPYGALGVGHSFTMHFYTVPGGTLGGFGIHYPCIFTRCHMVH